MEVEVPSLHSQIQLQRPAGEPAALPSRLAWLAGTTVCYGELAWPADQGGGPLATDGAGPCCAAPAAAAGAAAAAAGGVRARVSTAAGEPQRANPGPPKPLPLPAPLPLPQASSL
jgi:hypothetical protein